MRWTALFLLWVAAFTVVKAQRAAASFLKPVSEEAIVLPETAERKLVPLRYRTYELDEQGLLAALSRAPREFTPEARQQRCIIRLPLPNGMEEAFSVWETFQVEPALAAAMPSARTYAGEALNHPGMTVRFSHTLRGLNAWIYGPDARLSFLEVYAWGQTRYYMAYGEEDLPEEARPKEADLTCGFSDDGRRLQASGVAERGTLGSTPVQLKQYRIIISTTGEFSQDHGGTRDQVYAALVEYVNRINAVYERDLAIRFNLVQATLATIFLNPATDPFTGTDNGTLAAQNQLALEQAGVPLAAYDIGHVFARGGGGIAGLGVVCQNGKWRACSAGSGSYGLGFTYVNCHEIGHQLGANHSWNRCGGFAPDQRAGISAYEPGSGSTIMSYAGACGPDNVQGGADMYFHGGTLGEIRKYVDQESGAQCGTLTPTTNNHPAVSLPYSNGFFIPIRTPFELTSTATDADGDVLTYTWDQIDVGPETPLGTQLGNSPLFRSRPPASAPNRYFPQLNTIINNATDPRELLPDTTRNLTFRLTVRDGRGGVRFANLAFRATATAGPFTVAYPNTPSDRWNIGEYAEVRWNVANTDQAPVNCSRVNIRLSTDGGLTYPILLAERVSNDGSHYVKVPNLPTSSARVCVDGADNVFFDISNSNFAIQQPAQPSLTMGLENDAAVLCLPAQHTVTIFTAGVLGFNAPVTLDLTTPLPPGAVATFSQPTLQPGESATLTLDFSQVNVEGTFTLQLRATAAGVAPIVRPIVIRTIRNDFTGLALVWPPNGATDQALVQTLRWNKGLDAQTYDVQLATSPSFETSTIVASANNTALDSFRVQVFLNKGQPYFWRVRPRNECGAHAWTEPFFFSTVAERCFLWEANDLPRNLTANGTPVIESRINVLSGGVIKNMEVRRVKGYHEFFRDLNARLISPQGTEVVLWSGRCGNFNGFFNLRLTDASPSPFPCPPPNTGLPYQPQEPLAAFNGQNATGVWTLRVQDTQIGGGGVLEQFQLEFCSEITLNPPFLVNNNPLLVEAGNNHPIMPDLLLAGDADNGPADLTFTLLTVPQYGHLSKNWSPPLRPGDQFTQADINSGAIRFFDYGFRRDDSFLFIVSDGQGGFFGTPRFRIQTRTVRANEAHQQDPGFQLYPNPAREMAWIALSAPADQTLSVLLFDSAGRLVLQTLLPAGTTVLPLPMAGFAPGLYFVQVGQIMKKLVLLK
ncbi:MAG: zinc-dependent metalloprotease family protein [Saprospiraceae bacterium]|nr:M12 family metallo-peptidase [Saprospiraceae bacterium]MDW8228907.1 zinc-dependent metalloprotease family protein [Saprospiraceae bacterium]